MSAPKSWWTDAGGWLDAHPDLEAEGMRAADFANGALWMRRAMQLCDWQMPPPPMADRCRRWGWLKYSMCVIAALGVGAVGWFLHAGVLMCLMAVGAFYAVEAQMVFVFPELLLGRRNPGRSSCALARMAGGTLAVMKVVIPIAVRMLTGDGFRSSGHRAWLQGCVAIVLWHRRLSEHSLRWVEDESILPKGEVGACHPLLLRRETIGHGVNRLKVLWISDLHWRGMSAAQTLLAIHAVARQERPDVCLLGGDFIESRKALLLFQLLLKSLRRISLCVALPGNHDRGRFEGDVRNAVLAAKCQWLPDVDSIQGTTKQGLTWQILPANGVGNGTRQITLVAAHDPAEVVSAPANSVIMAGHLHGGQWVISSRHRRLLPAAWIYRHAWLRRSFQGAEWIISRGLGDTLPLRWNCPREIVCCEIYETR